MLNRLSHRCAVILVPRASVSFGHVVGERRELLIDDILRRVALGTRMGKFRQWYNPSRRPLQVFLISCADPAHNRPGEFENKGPTLKTHQMLTVHTTPGKFESATNMHWSFWICVWGNLRRGNLLIIVALSVWRAFSKSSVFLTDKWGAP